MNLICIGRITFIRIHFFKIFADSEADNEIDNSSIGNKTSDIYDQSPVCKSYYIVSELDYVLKSG